MKPVWVPLWIACAISGAALFFLIGKQLQQQSDLEAVWDATNRIGLVDLGTLLQPDTATPPPAFESQLLAEEMLIEQLGKQTPDGAAALNRLAGIHALQGNYSLAESEYREVAAILAEHLGPEHADVALVEKNLRTLDSLRTSRTAKPSTAPTNAAPAAVKP